MGDAAFEVYRDDAGEYRWRLRAANGEIIAASEGYSRREDARRAVDDVKEAAGAVEVIELPNGDE